MSVTLNASTSSGLVQTADTSGTIELQSNGTTRLTVASGGVTANNLTATGIFGGGVITSGTAVASTSGTSIDFTGIPSWVKRITININTVSTNGTNEPQIQLGTSGGVESTGYSSATGSTFTSNGARGTSYTSGFAFIYNGITSATSVFSGSVSINLLGSNTWCIQGVIAQTTSTVIANFVGGSKTLAGTLDRVRITTVNGTDTFDAGLINILYE